ncbi:MAG TPA: glycosyltransferase family 2 protein [Smithellaceae bacterium]|nr:glycosyltransferase family 2 protein [Smithellaceae bacterium]HRS88091.1 glycosyltransferase family 2 protein [Smithellaceae bacterium]HRV25435.1 glycosyltransferase family 2 protein [Smithellaceae bacterium]
MSGKKSSIASAKPGARVAVVIPVYNHAATITDVVHQTKELGYPVFVVDDGSTDDTPQKIKEILGIHVITHKANKGKGAAILSGFAAACRVADWVITIDADGQHYPQDARKLVDSLPDGARTLVVGKRLYAAGEHVPWTSRFGRKFSNFWVWASGGPVLSDSQSGMRIYPLPEAMNLGVKARRFQFEVEILVKAKRKGIPVTEVPVRVNYRPGGARVSHFRPFVDFLRNSFTFSRLIFARIFTRR